MSFSSQEWHIYQMAAMGLTSIGPVCVTLNTTWDGIAWCLNSTTWTVLSLEIHWHSLMESSQCASWHVVWRTLDHFTVHVWINTSEFAYNWCYFTVPGYVLLCWGSEPWNETVIDWRLFSTGYSILELQIFTGVCPSTCFYWAIFAQQHSYVIQGLRVQEELTLSRSTDWDFGKPTLMIHLDWTCQ